MDSVPREQSSSVARCIFSIRHTATKKMMPFVTHGLRMVCISRETHRTRFSDPMVIGPADARSMPRFFLMATGFCSTSLAEIPATKHSWWVWLQRLSLRIFHVASGVSWPIAPSSAPSSLGKKIVSKLRPSCAMVVRFSCFTPAPITTGRSKSAVPSAVMASSGSAYPINPCWRWASPDPGTLASPVTPACSPTPTGKPTFFIRATLTVESHGFSPK